MNGVTDKTREGFKQLLSHFREARIRIPISNRYPWQSKLAFLELLDLAASSRADVRILSGSGTDGFYGDEVARGIRQALERRCRVRVLVWNVAERSCARALRALAERFPDTMELRLSGTREGCEDQPHFIAVGEEACRLEVPHEPYDSVEFTEIWPETVAQIYFRAPRLTTALNRYFDRQWESCPVGASG